MAKKAVNPWLVARFIFVGAILSCFIYGSDCLVSSLHAADPDPYPSQVGGSWKGTGPLATERTTHTATLMLNGKVLVAGGYNSDSGYLAGAEIYDPAAGTWSGDGSLIPARGFSHGHPPAQRPGPGGGGL